MKPLGDRNDHFWLLQRMLQETGADAAAALSHGEISSEAWAQMVENCRGCGDVCACKRWLSDYRDGSRPPPDYCENALAIGHLPHRNSEDV